ncbi:MAG: dockerin type I repeat-containing protein, partial [Acutalibacteraceae bacterium]
ALADAQAVQADDEATQDEVDAAADALNAAVDALVEKPAEVDKTALEAAIEAAEALNADDYEDFSAVEAALTEAQAVQADDEATQDDVDAAVAALNAAVEALVEKPVDPITVIWLPYEDGTKGEGVEYTCPEAHGLWVRVNYYEKDEFGVEQPLYLQPYVGCELTFKFEMKLNKTENFPEALAETPEDDWIKHIHNGSLILYSGLGEDGKWTGEGGTSPYRFGPREAGNLVENLNTEDFIEVEVPMPEEIMDAGQLMHYAVLIYNDLNNLGCDNDKGVTLTVRNLRLIVDATNKVDKSALEELIDAEKTDEELEGYTAESVAAYKKLFEDAKAVLEDPEATTADVVEQVKKLQNADNVLVEDIAAGGTVPLATEPKNSGEKHYMNVVHTFNPPYDLAKYGKRDSYVLSFEMMVEATENMPAELLEGDAWLEYIVNGSVNLWTTDLGESKISLNTLEGDEKLTLNAGRDQLEGLTPGSYVTVTVPIPQAVVDAGVISQIEVFIYNDIPDSNDAGVTMTATNFQLTLGEVVDEPDQLEGDADGNGEITAADALMALQAATGKIDLTDAQKAAADVDGNGEVTAADALAILQFATGKIESFAKA